MASSSSEYDGYVEQYCSVEREGRSLRAQLLAYDSKQDSFYVHYVGHDRRMDQWVSVSAVDLASASHEVCSSPFAQLRVRAPVSIEIKFTLKPMPCTARRQQRITTASAALTAPTGWRKAPL
jgi:hypothetical protein